MTSSISRSARNYLSLVVLTTAALLATSIVHAEETQEADPVQELFGKEIKRVQATRETSDDVTLALEMLKSAQLEGLEDKTKLSIIKALIPLAAKDPAGFSVAEDGLILLDQFEDVDDITRGELHILQSEPRYEKSGNEKKAETARAYFDDLMDLAIAYKRDADPAKAQTILRQAAMPARHAGDDAVKELGSTFKRLGPLVATQRKVQALEIRFAQFPDNAKLADELCKFYVLEFNAPHKALHAAKVSEDENFSKYIPLAAKKIHELEPQQMMELGEWYESLAEDVREDLKVSLLGQARDYYDTYLMKDEEENATTIKVNLALKRVNEKLSNLETFGRESTTIKTIDLYPILSNKLQYFLANHHVHTDWKIDQRMILARVGNQDSHTGQVLNLPIKATGDYQLDLKMYLGNAFLVIPVGKGSMGITLIGGEGKASGEASTNALREDPKIKITRLNVVVGKRQGNEPSRITIQSSSIGNKGRVAVLVDGEEAVKWEGPIEELKVQRYRKFPTRAQFALAPVRSNQFYLAGVTVKGRVALYDTSQDKFDEEQHEGYY